MNEELESLAGRVRDQQARVRALFESTDAERLVRRPIPERWSVVEHIAHIGLTDRPYLERIHWALEKGRVAGRLGSGPYRGGVIGNWFARSMAPPPKRRMRTTKRLEPPIDLDPVDVLADFEARCDALVASLVAADGLDLDALRMSSPFLALLRMPVSSAYRVLVGHGDRHLWLVEEMLGRSDRAVADAADEDAG